MTRFLAALLAISTASPTLAQDTFSCVVATKCGKSGMCVPADETLKVETEGGRYLVQGILANDDREFQIDDEGRFVWHPDPKATHEPGTDVDQMAVRFSGVCNS